MGIRLPCRYDDRFYNGDDGALLDQIGWFTENGKSGTHPVGRKRPNAWGLNDMLGHVWQWCADGFGPYAGDESDPTGPVCASTDVHRVIRGGSWWNVTPACRCAARDHNARETAANYLGFRVCLFEPAMASATQPTVSPRPTRVNSIGIKLVQIPSGEFMMGSPVAEPGRGNDERQHRAKISKDFFMAAYPVTRGQFAAFVRETGYLSKVERHGFLAEWSGTGIEKVPGGSWEKPGFAQTGDDPVVAVSWHDAMKFCQWLSQKERKSYRLPTEAEWEYACRAGTQKVFCAGDSGAMLAAEGWYVENSGWRTRPVGRKIPNAWGLYDMLGNERQWCSDWYGPYGDGDNITDPVGPPAPANAKGRGLRGGSWTFDLDSCRCALRGYGMDGAQCNWIGFRVCLSLEKSDEAK